jgi:hypothetical protein
MGEDFLVLANDFLDKGAIRKLPAGAFMRRASSSVYSLPMCATEALGVPAGRKIVVPLFLRENQIGSIALENYGTKNNITIEGVNTVLDSSLQDNLVSLSGLDNLKQKLKEQDNINGNLIIEVRLLLSASNDAENADAALFLYDETGQKTKISDLKSCTQESVQNVS